MTSAVIDAAGLVQLVSTLIGRGYRVLGPTQSDDAIVPVELDSADDLPRGSGADVLHPPRRSVEFPMPWGPKARVNVVRGR
jgi:hypothetical protein